MLAVFCLRLSCGLVAALLLFPSRLVNPRFYRVHFLTALGLTAAAGMLVRDGATVGVWAGLAAALALSFWGSVAWSLEGAPGGRMAIPLAAAALALALGLT